MKIDTIQSFIPPTRILMGPGPSDVYPRVLQAIARPTIGHLDPAFMTMMDEIKVLLQYAFQTKNALTFPISAPGSAGRTRDSRDRSASASRSTRTQP